MLHVIKFYEAHYRQCAIALVMWLTLTQWLSSFNDALPHRKRAQPLQVFTYAKLGMVDVCQHWFIGCSFQLVV